MEQIVNSLIESLSIRVCDPKPNSSGNWHHGPLDEWSSTPEDRGSFKLGYVSYPEFVPIEQWPWLGAPNSELIETIQDPSLDMKSFYKQVDAIILDTVRRTGQSNYAASSYIEGLIKYSTPV